MARIRVSPEQLFDTATKFNQASGQSQDMVRDLENLMNGLQSEWEGMTSQSFFHQFEQCKGSMRQFSELLDSIGQQLKTIGDRFAAADQG